MRALADLADTSRGISTSPRGRDFVRSSIALSKAAIPIEAVAIAEQRWGPGSRAALATKAAVEGMTTGNTSDLLGPAAIEFFQVVSERSIVGRLTGLRRVPLNTRLLIGTKASAYWPGEGRGKPLTNMSFAAATLTPAKVTAVAAATTELLESADVSAEAAIQNELVRAYVQAIDEAFVSPSNAGVSLGESIVKPASVTYGVDDQGTGTTLKADVIAMVAVFEGDLDSAVLIASPGLMLGAAGTDFPLLGVRGGSALGFPVLTSRYVPDGVLVLVDPTRIVYAEGAAEQRTVREGDYLMDAAASSLMDVGGIGSPSGPTSASLVSLWQTNTVALLVGRAVNWGALPGAVALVAAADYATP
jgi:hypothetical protein